MNTPNKESPSYDPRNFRIPKHWSPEQALAVFEFLEELASLVWEQYDPQLVQLLRPDFEPEPCEQLDLFDFDDEIPF